MKRAAQCSIAFIILLGTIFISFPAICAEIVIDDFENGLAPEWEKKVFAGEPIYEFTQDDNRNCIKAISRGAAGGLYYKISFDPQEYPIITWSWKVDHVLVKGDARKKSGDDYAARLYVVFPSVFFWRTKAINYIWANKLPKGEAVPSSYTDNSIIVAVESGSELTGNWVNEKRNILEDYKRYFDKIPNKVGAIAIMTDTDNTREDAVAFYGPIKIFSPDYDR